MIPHQKRTQFKATYKCCQKPENFKEIDFLLTGQNLLRSVLLMEIILHRGVVKVGGDQ